MVKSKSKPKAKGSSTKQVEDGKACAILAYFLVGMIWYAVDDNMKKNAFAKFHVKQALILLIIDVILWVLNIVLFFLYPLWAIVWLLLFVLWIFGLVYSIQGEEKEIPLVGQFAKKYFKF